MNDHMFPAVLPKKFAGEIATKEYPFALVVMPSRAKAWKICRNLCARAPFFLENESAFLAMFGDNYESVALLGNALAIAGRWRNVFYFMDGEFVPCLKEATYWIPCFRGSNYARDLRAHCISMSFWEFGKGAIVPCKYISTNVLSSIHGFSLRDKVVAEAVNRGVLGCPHLRRIINDLPG